MMKQVLLTVANNQRIAENVYRMCLTGDQTPITAPGQFINIKIDGFFLRRPISVCDVNKEELTIVYKTVGGGTEALSKLTNGAVLDVLSGLGNGYDLLKSGNAPLLAGGGVGTPPLYYLCKKLSEQKKTPTVVLGFNDKRDVILEEDFKALGAKVFVATANGSYGVKGFVTDVIKELDYTFFYACGPEPMFKAMSKIMKTKGQYSFEERMGCGFGACMGCSCKTLTGNKRICREGPCMESEDILWD